MNPPPESPPTRYLCQRCTACCQWPGDVKISSREITQIARFLDLQEDIFIHRFTRLRRDRQGLSLIDHPDGSCIFLEDKNCLIQSVKPTQCQGFPNTWKVPGWRERCQAIPLPHS